MRKTNSLFKRTVSMILSLAMMLTFLPTSVFASSDSVVFLPQDEISEEVSRSGEFYLASSVAQIAENADSSFLLKIARGSDDLPSASVRLNMFDVTAKYGKDYTVRIYSGYHSDNEVQNADSNLSILEEIMNNTDEIVEENYSHAIISGEALNADAAEELYSEDFAALDEFFTEEVDGYAEEKEAFIEAIETADVTTLSGAKELATGLKSDKVAMDGAKNSLDSYTKEMVSALSLELNSAYLVVDFEEGETEKYIEIIPKDNKDGDGDRMFSINLCAVSENAIVGANATATVYIIDNEEQLPATVSFKEERFYPEDGYIKATVIRSGAVNQMISVNIKTEDVSAVKERDYSEVNTSVVFPYGITERTINIPIRSDYIDDVAEFKLVIEDVLNCTVGEIGTAYGEIASTNESFDILSATGGTTSTSRDDATTQSIIGGEPMDLEKDLMLSFTSSAGYIKMVDDALEMYVGAKGNEKWDESSSIHLSFRTSRYDISGFMLDWEKSSGKPCYTSTYFATAGNALVTEWESGEERWDRRTDTIFSSQVGVRNIQIMVSRTGSFFGTSPTLRIHSVTPVLRPFEVTLKGAEPLKFLNEDGEYVDNTLMTDVVDATSTILRGANNTGTGTAVKFSGDDVTVTTNSKYAYIKGLKIIHSETGYSKVVVDDLPEGTTSASFKITNDFLTQNLDCIHYCDNGDNGIKGTFYVQPIMDYYDSQVRIYTDYRGVITATGNPEVVEDASGTTLIYHKGDKMRFTQTIHEEHISAYVDTRIRFAFKETSASKVVDSKLAYDEGTKYCAFNNIYSSIEVYPNFDKRENHVVVRVAKKDLAKFDANYGVLTAPWAEIGNYMEYVVVDNNEFASGTYYEFSARAKENGYTPVWRKINTTKKFSQGTFFFEGTDEIEENIIFLTCEKADEIPYSITGKSYYSNVALRSGTEGQAWTPASGVCVIIGKDTYGISGEDGSFNTAAMYGINGMSVIYKVLASGKTMYRTTTLSNEKISQFGSAGVTTEAYDVGIGTIMASPSNTTAPYIGGVVATNEQHVETGVINIDDMQTLFTIAINNNGSTYYDSDGLARTEKVIAVDLIVYESRTHRQKEVLSGAVQLTDLNGISMWTFSHSFKKGESARYSSSDELYVRITTDRVVGNGKGYNENGEFVDLDSLNVTEYAPVNTGYTFAESNRKNPVYQEVNFPTDIDFIPLPIIGSLAATYNMKSLSLNLSNLPNGGHRLSIGKIIKSANLVQSDALADNGVEYKKDEIAKAASDVKTMGKEMREAGLSTIGRTSWGVAPILGLYFDFGIKNVYYTDYVTQKLVFIGGGMYGGITGKFRRVWYIVLGTIPCYVGIDGQITGYLELGFTAVNEMTATSDRLLSEANSLEKDYEKLNVVAGISCSLQAYAGAGICGLIGARGGFTFYPSYVYQPLIKELYPDYHEHGGTLTVQLKFWLDAFFFPIPIPAINFVKEKYGYFKDVADSDVGELASLGGAKEQNGTTVTVKERTQASEWLPYADEISPLSTFVPDTSTVLLENGYDRATPKLIDIGDGRIMLAFIADDASRTDKDRTALMYSIYEDGVWSTPVTVQNDGTADFEPNLCDAGDKILISWVSRDASVDYTGELEFLKSLEIYTTTLDKETLEIGDIERLTNDEFYDNAPVGVYDEISGDYVVYYLKAEVGHDFLTSVSPTTNESVIVYMLYDAKEGKWARDYYYDNEVESEEAEDILVTYWGGQRFLASPIEDFNINDPIIVDFGAISYNGIGVYTYTVDQDNNMSTESDRELFVQIYDFESHATYVPVRITEDNVSDARPQLVRNGDHTMLFWLRNNEDVRYINVTDLIKNGVNDDGTINRVDYEFVLGAVSYVPTGTNINPTFGSYTAFVDKDGNLYVAWLQPVSKEDGGSAQEIYASAFIHDDNKGSSWSDGVRLTYSDAVHDEVALITDANGDLVTVSNQYTVDFASEKIGVDNIKLIATQYKTVGSLEVVDFAYSNDAPQAGTTVSVNASIKNTGLKNANGYTVKVYETLNGNVGREIYSLDSDTIISPSSSDYVTFDWTVPESFSGSEKIALKIEVQEAGTEEVSTYTSDDIKICPVYDITSYSIEERTDGFYATYTVKNIGNADATDPDNKVVIGFNDIYLSGEGTKTFNESPIGSLKINEEKTFTMPLNIDEKYFEFGYTNAFIEVQDKEGESIGKYQTFMIVLEFPYNISINGDTDVTEIRLSKGESLPLDIDYVSKEFYNDGEVNYEILDTSVASVNDGSLIAKQSGETEMTVMVAPYGGYKSVKIVVEDNSDFDIADLDNDGLITIRDVLLAIHMLLNDETEGFPDMNGDEIASLADILRIMKMLL